MRKLGGAGGLVLGLLAGCANVSTLQTARVLPEGKIRYYAGAGYLKNQSPEIPTLEGGVRLGLGHQAEVSAKYVFPATGGVEGKYQLTDDDHLATAFGAGIFYLGQGNLRSLDLVLPLYASYDFSGWFGIYIATKYLSRFYQDSTSLSFAHFGGASLGLRMGERSGLFVEATALASLLGGLPIYEANIGVFFSDEPSVPVKNIAPPDDEAPPAKKP